MRRALLTSRRRGPWSNSASSMLRARAQKHVDGSSAAPDRYVRLTSAGCTTISRRGTRAAARHAAALNQLRADATGGVARTREAEPLGAADHRGIDADYARVAVNQGTTAVAGVERNVALDDGVHQPTVLRPQGAAERADHAGADGEGETERVADRHHQLADAHFAAAAQR